jgi:glycosyltransferase involved in cell wall biosynthesis
MGRPTFSVIIPTYNRACLLPRAIRSVLSQTFEDFELIVVDDATTDSTGEVVASFEDERIIYVRREESGSAAAARNTGIQRARGECICLLDDDDEYLPGFLETTLRILERDGDQVGFSGCGVRMVDTTTGREAVTDHLPLTRNVKNGEARYLSFLHSIPFGSGWGLTVRRACFDVVGLFDERLRSEEDRDLLIRLAQHFDFAVIPEILVRVHRHSGPRVNTYGPEKARAYELMLWKHRDTLMQHPRLWAAWHYKIGWLHYHSGDRQRGRAFILRGLVKWPWHVRSWAGLLLYEGFGSRGSELHQAVSGVLKKARFMDQWP